MFLFIPRALCALKRLVARTEHARYGATTGIHFWTADGMYRAEATDGRRAIVVQGLVPEETPNWPGLKDLPDDAFETIVLPKDLERACKLGEEFVQKSFKLLGMATKGNQILLGLGEDCIVTRLVEGRFPEIRQVVPTKPPLFSFRVDPRLLAEALLTVADLLPDANQGVDVFYYGEGLPLGLCAKDHQSGTLIDALVVPLTVAKEQATEPSAEPGEQDEEQLIDEEPIEETEELPEEPTIEPEAAPEEQPVEEPIEQPSEHQSPSKKRRRKTAKA